MSGFGNLMVTSLARHSLGVPAPKPHPPLMSPISFDQYCRNLRCTHNINKLQHIHCEISKELLRRFSGPMTDANPDLSGATVQQLMWILDRTFDQMRVIATTAQAHRDALRYGSQELGSGSGADQRLVMDTMH